MPVPAADPPILRLLYRVTFLHRVRATWHALTVVVDVEPGVCDMVSPQLAERKARARLEGSPDAADLVLYGTTCLGPANGWPDAVTTD